MFLHGQGPSLTFKQMVQAAYLHTTQCLALSILWTLRGVSVDLWTSTMVVHIFFICPNQSVWNDMRAAFQLLQCGALTVWSWELICPDLYSRGVGECKSAASLRHKSEDYVGRREPNLVQPCPCHLLGVVTDAFCVSHSGLRASS